MLFMRRPRGDPRLAATQSAAGKPLVRIGRRHHHVGVAGSDAGGQFFQVDLPRRVEPQIGLPICFIRPMTEKAIIRKYGADVLAEIDRHLAAKRLRRTKLTSTIAASSIRVLAIVAFTATTSSPRNGNVVADYTLPSRLRADPGLRGRRSTAIESWFKEDLRSAVSQRDTRKFGAALRRVPRTGTAGNHISANVASTLVGVTVGSRPPDPGLYLILSTSYEPNSPRGRRVAAESSKVGATAATFCIPPPPELPIMIANRSDSLAQIRAAGVIGAGGAGFPTYQKLDAKVDWIIANGAECEPLLQKDREVMRRDAIDMLRGLELMRELTGASHVTVAVKRKNEDIIDQFADEIAAREFETFIYEDVYPAGDEYVLVYEITGRQIPPGGIPLQVGCVVDNVETIVNAVRAVEGAPVVDKYVSVCGAVVHPLTTVVPVGTSMADCIELAGGATVDRPAALTGGVMMGGTTDDFSIPVSKVVGGIIVLPDDHYLYRRKTQSQATYTRIGHGQCDQCSLCTELCPRYILGYPIEPHMVMRTLLMTGSAKERGSLWAQYCCECNVCSLIACPEQLDPARICIDAKQVLREEKLSRTEQELETLFRPPHPARKGGKCRSRRSTNGWG